MTYLPQKIKFFNQGKSVGMWRSATVVWDCRSKVIRVSAADLFQGHGDGAAENGGGSRRRAREGEFCRRAGSARLVAGAFLKTFDQT